MIYVGQKKSDKFLDKKYLGSGSTIRTLLGSGATEDRFDIKMIDTADSPEELNDKEIYWIETYDAMNPRIGYNRCYGGATNAGFKQSDYQKQRAADYMKTRVVTDVTRQNMSSSARSRTSNRVTNNNQVWVTNGFDETMATSEEVIEYLSQGYYFGRIPLSDEHKNTIKSKYSRSTYMMKGTECKLIDNEHVPEFLERGWIIQRNCYSDERNSNISKSKSGTIKIINPETLKTKYIKPEEFSVWEDQGFIRTKDFKKKTL